MPKKCIFDKKEDERTKKDCPHADEVEASNYQVCFPCSMFHLAGVIEKMQQRSPR